MGYTVSADASLMNMGAANAALGLQGIVNAYKNNNSSDKLQRDALQQALIDKQNNSEQDMYNKINTLPGTPHNTLDSNIHNFWMSELDYAYDIKSLAKNGQMSNRDANAILAKLGSDMDTYTALAPQILAQAEIMKAAIADGSISRANANEMQMMFMGIANNAGDINIARGEDGNMYLSGSGTMGGEAWEGKVNIKEIQQFLSTEGNQIARTIPTSEEMGLKTIFDELKATGQFDQYMEPGYEQKVVDGRVMRQPSMKFTTQGLADLRTHLMQNPGLFEKLMKSETGVSAWTDVANANLSTEQLNGTIGETMIVDGEEVANPLAGKQDWGKWDVNDAEKKNYMKGALIDRMLAENLDKEVLGKLELDKQYYDRQNAVLTAGSGLPDGVDPNNPCGHLKGEALKKCGTKQRIDALVETGNIQELDGFDGISVKLVNGEWKITMQAPPKWDSENEEWIDGKGEPIEEMLNLSKPGDILQKLYDATGVSEFAGSTMYTFSPDGKSYRSGPMIDWNAATQPKDQTFGGEGNTFQGVMDGITAEIDAEIKAARKGKREPKIMDWKEKLDKKIGGTESTVTEVTRDDGSTYFETTPASGGDSLRSVWKKMGVNIDNDGVVTIDEKIAGPLLQSMNIEEIFSGDGLNNPAEFKQLLDIMANVSVRNRKQENARIAQLKRLCNGTWNDELGKCEPKTS